MDESFDFLNKSAEEIRNKLIKGKPKKLKKKTVMGSKENLKPNNNKNFIISRKNVIKRKWKTQNTTKNKSLSSPLSSSSKFSQNDSIPSLKSCSDSIHFSSEGSVGSKSSEMEANNYYITSKDVKINEKCRNKIDENAVANVTDKLTKLTFRRHKNKSDMSSIDGKINSKCESVDEDHNILRKNSIDKKHESLEVSGLDEHKVISSTPRTNASEINISNSKKVNLDKSYSIFDSYSATSAQSEDIFQSASESTEENQNLGKNCLSQLNVTENSCNYKQTESSYEINNENICKKENKNQSNDSFTPSIKYPINGKANISSASLKERRLNVSCTPYMDGHGLPTERKIFKKTNSKKIIEARSRTISLNSNDDWEDIKEELDNISNNIGPKKSVNKNENKTRVKKEDSFIVDSDDDSSSSEEDDFSMYHRFIANDIKSDVKVLKSYSDKKNINKRNTSNYGFTPLRKQNAIGEKIDERNDFRKKLFLFSEDDFESPDSSPVTKLKSLPSTPNTNSPILVPKSSTIKKKVKRSDSDGSDITPTSKIKSKQVRSPFVENKIKLSFLASLTGKSAEVEGILDPEAMRYVKNFKKLKEELARKLFLIYNSEVFKDKLPDDMKIEWNGRMHSTSGICKNKRNMTKLNEQKECVRESTIVLSSKVIQSCDRLRDTLIHELCHAATWILDNRSDGHGHYWISWTKKAMKRFPEIPAITRCHDYSISTKFTYRCVQCGYSFGRHSKSLNTDRKICGYCKGKFELFRNNKGGERVKVDPFDELIKSNKPKTMSKFALFVKENYVKVKEENSYMKHGEIMKELGSKYAIAKQQALTNES